MDNRAQKVTIQLIEEETYTAQEYSGKALGAIAYSRCTFKSCVFNATDMRHARFEGCTFIGCKISNPKMEGCRLQETSFAECKIVGGEFHKCDKTFFSVSFKNSLLDCCNFSDKNMKKSAFIGCKIRECYFTSTLLSQSDFAGSDLSGSVFHECDLTQTDFSKASRYHIDPRTNKIKKARFSLPEAVGLLQAFDIIIE